MRSIEQLTKEILSLPNESRALLADKLVESLEFDTDSAIQAVWASHKQTGITSRIEDLCDKFLALDESTRAIPNAANVELYKQMQKLHDQIAHDLQASFTEHRKLIAT